MGLDTWLCLRNDEEKDVAYWRKCWGIDEWLQDHSPVEVKPEVYEFDTEILQRIILEMDKYLYDIMSEARQKGYYVETKENLQALVDSDKFEPDEVEYFEKRLKSFACNDLYYDDFEESLWGGLQTFVDTYFKFQEAVKYPKLLLMSSY